jgi:hypothetical protein
MREFVTEFEIPILNGWLDKLAFGPQIFRKATSVEELVLLGLGSSSNISSRKKEVL